MHVAHRMHRRILWMPITFAVLAAAAVTAEAGDAPESAVGDGIALRYETDGALLTPVAYREWVFLSSGLDMSYSEDPAMEGQSMFDNVFVNRSAWAAFRRTGHWPDKTVFVMEARGASSHGSINKQGKYQTEELMGLEYHVHDEARFKATGGWGFFAGEAAGPAKLLPASAPCYACHRDHGAVDTTFTQFYPTAKTIAVKAGTYRSAD
jgi:hypothetical protein